MPTKKNRCPLCGGTSKYLYKKEFLLCSTCKGIYRPRQSLLSTKQEKKRYLEHNNDIHDPRYKQFISPITSAILKSYSPEDEGLDFGAGTGPVISAVLQKSGYNIKQYDPFFYNDPKLFNSTYDYIACCEVVEHFYDPALEFARLYDLLKTGGRLYCMTNLYDQTKSLDTWRYMHDPTHVFIYQRETFAWIKLNFKFDIMIIHDRLIELGK